MEFTRIIWERSLAFPVEAKRDPATVTANSIDEAIEKVNSSVDFREKTTTLQILENFKKTEEAEKWTTNYSGIEIRKNPLSLVRIEHSKIDGRVLSVDLEAFRPLKFYDDPIFRFLRKLF